jgi:hypothetical protein
MSSGFDRAELSMLAAERTVDEKLGHKYQKIAELEDDPIVPNTGLFRGLRCGTVRWRSSSSSQPRCWAKAPRTSSGSTLGEPR